MTQPTHDPTARQTFEARMEGFGREAQAAGERFGRQAEAAGKRLAADPAMASAATNLARLWGLVILAVGVWFFAEVTLGLNLPAVPWDAVWPLAIILLGLVIIVRGLGRRRA